MLQEGMWGHIRAKGRYPKNKHRNSTPGRTVWRVF